MAINTDNTTELEVLNLSLFQKTKSRRLGPLALCLWVGGSSRLVPRVFAFLGPTCLRDAAIWYLWLLRGSTLNEVSAEPKIVDFAYIINNGIGVYTLGLTYIHLRVSRSHSRMGLKSLNHLFTSTVYKSSI